MNTNTESHRKAEQVLRGAGYRPLRQFQPTVSQRVHKDELFETWVGPDGKVVIVHFYGGANGCAFYWPDGGLDWEQTAERLKNPVGGPPKWQGMDSAPRDGTVILARWPGTGARKLWWWDGKPDPNVPVDPEDEPRSIPAYAPGWYDGHGFYEGLTEWQPMPV